MNKTWEGTLKNKHSFPQVLRLDKGFPCYHAAHEIRLAWRLSAQPRTLSFVYER